jgi:uncharacterized membrane protein YdbT with pleckstrin-like domain
MTYVQQTLLPEEKILYHTKPHYIVFYPLFLWLILALFFFNSDNTLFGTLLLLLSVLSLINSIINYYYSEYAITNKRIIMKIGFIRRKSLEIFLDRIEGIYVEQSMVGRILGFGTVFVGGIGGTKNPFFYIPHPIEFRNKVQQQMQN